MTRFFSFLLTAIAFSVCDVTQFLILFCHTSIVHLYPANQYSTLVKVVWIFSGHLWPLFPSYWYTQQGHKTTMQSASGLQRKRGLWKSNMRIKCSQQVKNEVIRALWNINQREYNKGGQSAAHGPNPARRDLLSGL